MKEVTMMEQGKLHKGELLKYSKYVLITYLIMDKGLTLREVIELEPVKVPDYFDESTPDFVVECLQEHSNKTNMAFYKSNRFFPGKDGKSESSEDSISIGLRGYFKADGRDWADIKAKLATRKSKETDFLPGNTKEDILAAFRKIDFSHPPKNLK